MSKKAEKISKASASISKMYVMESVYDESVRIDPGKVSKMYPMNNVYGEEFVVEAPAVNEVNAPKSRKDKNSKPAKQETLVKEGISILILICSVNNF